MNSIATYLTVLFTRYKILTLVLAIALIWILFGYLTGGEFLSPRNFSNLLRQMAITGMLASGMVFIIIAGEIDLSVGSLLGLIGGVVAILDAHYHLPVVLTIGLAIGMGGLIGLASGYWVAYLRVPSFIVSLAGMMAYRGVLLGITGGSTIAPVSDNVVLVGQGYLPFVVGDLLGAVLFVVLAVVSLRSRARHRELELPVAPMWQDVAKLAVTALVIIGFVTVLDAYRGVPIPVLVLLVVMGLFTVMANRTVFGRRIYAVGGNLEATRLSGVNVQRVKMLVFGLLGIMCAFAGITTTARLAAGSPSAGTSGELDAIASCFLGGTSMRGGSGTVFGALIGALIMASLDNGMSMLDVDNFWQMIVKGAILLLAVWLDIATGSKR
ncbi:MAG: sugar ABC transporter permease [Azospirillaceae bacterium]|nr:sugar ABC transporter permease [Azospirillaceae bacterium]